MLGEHQSGEIAEVGYDLYNRMLMQAVKALKRGETPQAGDPLQPRRISIFTPRRYPSAYVPGRFAAPGLLQSLCFWQKTARPLEKSTEALVDCYGNFLTPPDASLKCINCALKCEAIGIRRIDAAPRRSLLPLRLNRTSIRSRPREVLQSRRDAQMLGPERLKLTVANPDPEKRL